MQEQTAGGSSPGPGRLVIFTRYPQPGTTKTRLIPALGPEGAADLQRQMTEHTLGQVAAWQTQFPHDLTVEIWFSGGDRSQMADWLGAQWAYYPQGEGDLGDRLQRAGNQDPHRALLVIGIDCPGIDVLCLEQAWRSLHHSEVVLGPAMDGGYYLLGMRRWQPALVQDISWSTDQVLAQTMAIAQEQGLTLATLRPLSDVDEPQDLAVWTNHRERSPHARLSIIIPTLNEATAIASTLRHIGGLTPAPFSDLEVLVVDGGSQDSTLAQARAQGAIALSAPPGRAQQMNCGAQVATGEVLLFLHADTQLPTNAAEEVARVLAQPSVVAGAFTLRIDGANPGLRWVEWGVGVRSRLWQLPYGDQGIFLTAQQFWQVGGFPNQPIMEDVELVRRLKPHGRVAIAPASVMTSARRWQRLGLIKTTLLNQIMLIGYRCGVSPDRLAHWYRGRPLG